jgi:hypothetical protein
VFPQARIVHLYRHPRDQWLSTLYKQPPFPLNARAADFPSFDKFYLLMWARDLKAQFPFLDPRQDIHPYELFYLIWKLSFLFGRRYADVSVSFEQIIEQPQSELAALFDAIGFECPVDQSILQVVERPKLGRWVEYADNEWFLKHEERCERTLADFFAASGEPCSSLTV